jgi:predicted S18 family serine protease
MSALYGYILAAFLVAATLIGGTGYVIGYKYARTEAEAAMEKHLAADKEQERLATEDARAKEQELIALQNTVAQAYERGKQNAELQNKRVVDDLRSGALRLRQQWSACQAGNMPNSTTPSGKLNAATGDREESAGRIIRAAAECDAQVTGLQRLLTPQQ